MDLELTDEQRWLSESIETLLDREWLPPEAVGQATLDGRRGVWQELVAFGALSLGDDGIGAVEACLIARALGARLGAAPFVASASLRLALGERLAGEMLDADAAVALAALEPGASWSLDQSPEEAATALLSAPGGWILSGEKVAVEQIDLADRLAVVASLEGEPALAVVAPAAPGVAAQPRAGFDPTLPMSAVRFDDVHLNDSAVLTGARAHGALERLGSAGALLAASEAIGAADRVLGEACRYAAERRQFGRPIGSFQSVRHILADMYVRSASGWSAVLYAAASFDDGAEDAARTASIAKAYVARGAREVAHGAMQVFGGIAFTDEHPAHRFLRRIVVRERQFGDATHHERRLGRELAEAARARSAHASLPQPAPA